MDDESVYELILKYFEESKDTLSFDEEYLLRDDEESSTLRRLNILMNRIENLIKSSNLFNNDEELILLDNEASLNSIISSSMSYKDTLVNLNE